MRTLQNDLAKAISYLSQSDQKEVERALLQAKEWHGDQKRESGDLYITHPIAVAAFLGSLEADKETIAAALLHDVIEDGCVSKREVEAIFGNDIAAMVDGVTKLSKMEYKGKRTERQLGSLRKMLLTASNDLRVIFIKLADRWHNIETIDALRQDKQERVANETLDIYVPFARLVGLWNLKSRFETVCFPLAYPNESRVWAEIIAGIREKVSKERMDFIHRVNTQTTDNVEAALDKMTDFEIFTKLQGNEKRIEQVSNIDTALILLKGNNVSAIDCYRVLGEIHQQYPLRFGSFRDFISTPQPNGYRGLHTVIFLSHNHEFRLRIQTKEMYEYVSRRTLSSWMAKQKQDIYAALNAIHKPSYNRDKYMKDVKDSVLEKRMNVFTSSGGIIALPRGATGVDFAFAINPDHLSYLAGIRINGEVREATHALQDGDIADLILLTNGKTDNKSSWVEKTKSVEARQFLRDSLGKMSKERKWKEGRTLLEIELRKRRLPVWSLLHISAMQKQLTSDIGCKSFDEMMRKIGTGQIPVSQVTESYKNILTAKKPSLFIWLMKILRLLPRSRVLNKDLSVITIEIYAEDRQGLIYDIASCFAQRSINISQFSVYAVPPKDALYKLKLEVKSYDEFSGLYDALLQVPSVKTVLRKR